MKASVTQLKNTVDIFTIGAQSGILWSHNNEILAGFGETKRIEYNDSNLFTDSLDYLKQIDLENPYPRKIYPVAFTALPFTRSENATVLIPKYTLQQFDDGSQYLIAIDSTDPLQFLKEFMASSDTESSFHSDLANQSTHAAETEANLIECNVGIVRDSESSFNISSTLSEKDWKSKVVGEALKRIDANDIKKVVLSRQMHINSDQEFDLELVMNRLKRNYSKAILFSIDGFVGASPEMLVSKNNEDVTAHPLAGTEPRNSNPELDNVARESLLKSTKDQWEHQITIDWFLDSLMSYCSYVDAEPEPTIVELANVFHLGTKVHGKLSSPDVSICDLVNVLHPTPAVAGDPQKTALKIIEELEPNSRGRYAGPVGWFDASGDGSFAVGIRSAEILGPSAIVNAGVGVVKDSDPEKEFIETKAKSEAMLTGLGIKI